MGVGGGKALCHSTFENLCMVCASEREDRGSFAWFSSFVGMCSSHPLPSRLVEPSQRGCVALDLDDSGLDVLSAFLGSVSSALEPEVSFANSHFRLATRFNVDFPNTVLVRDRLIDPHAPDVLCTPFACAHHTSCTLSRGDVPKSESSYKWCSSCLHNDRPLRYFLRAQAGFRVQTPKASHQGRRQLRFKF